MYFHESEAIARECSGLQRVVEQIDGHLATIFNPAPLRPEDFSGMLACDTNQVVSVFDLLAQREVLEAESWLVISRIGPTRRSPMKMILVLGLQSTVSFSSQNQNISNAETLVRPGLRLPPRD